VGSEVGIMKLKYENVKINEESDSLVDTRLSLSQVFLLYPSSFFLFYEIAIKIINLSTLHKKIVVLIPTF
jgi:hypothetical protein